VHHDVMTHHIVLLVTVMDMLVTLAGLEPVRLIRPKELPLSAASTLSASTYSLIASMLKPISCHKWNA
jgi:hypothetical protein